MLTSGLCKNCQLIFSCMTAEDIKLKTLKPFSSTSDYDYA